MRSSSSSGSGNQCQYCKQQQTKIPTTIDYGDELDQSIHQLLKQNNSSNSNRNNLKQISIICECESANSETIHKNYDAFLDNLIQQLISALKIKDLIRLEICNTNTNNNSSDNNNNTDRNLIKSKINYFICKSCKKIKLIENKASNLIQDTASAAFYSIDANNIFDPNNILTNNSKFESNQALINFQELLIKQKEQQLNVLNELSKMLKPPNKLNNNNKSETLNATTTTAVALTDNNAHHQLKSSSSLISLKTTASFSKFNFSKVFHSLSSIELRQQTNKSDSKSIFSSTTYTSLSNQNIFVSNNNSNNLQSQEEDEEEEEEDNYSNINNSNNNNNINIEFISNINSVKFVNDGK